MLDLTTQIFCIFNQQLSLFRILADGFQHRNGTPSVAAPRDVSGSEDDAASAYPGPSGRLVQEFVFDGLIRFAIPFACRIRNGNTKTSNPLTDFIPHIDTVGQFATEYGQMTTAAIGINRMLADSLTQSALSLPERCCARGRTPHRSEMMSFPLGAVSVEAGHWHWPIQIDDPQV